MKHGVCMLGPGEYLHPQPIAPDLLEWIKNPVAVCPINKRLNSDGSMEFRLKLLR